MVFSGRCSVYVCTGKGQGGGAFGKARKQDVPERDIEEIRRRLTLFRKYERGDEEVGDALPVAELVAPSSERV